VSWTCDRSQIQEMSQHPRKPSPSDGTDEEWAFVAAYLTLMAEDTAGNTAALAWVEGGDTGDEPGGGGSARDRIGRGPAARGKAGVRAGASALGRDEEPIDHPAPHVYRIVAGGMPWADRQEAGVGQEAGWR